MPALFTGQSDLETSEQPKQEDEALAQALRDRAMLERSRVGRDDFKRTDVGLFVPDPNSE